MNPTPPEESRPLRRGPEETRARKRSPVHYTRNRRTGRRRKRSRTHIVLAIVLLGGLIVTAAWKWFSLANRAPKGNPEQAKRERAALVASINKILAETGKNVPVADVVINSAEYHDRDGKRYVTGTIRNRSRETYDALHLTFDTFDYHHNRIGEVEGDVVALAAGEEAPFEIGPASLNARTCTLSSIRVVKR